VFEYLRKKLDELLGSLINPIWERVLRAPWWLRLLILILLAPVAYGLYAPESVGHYLKLSAAIARVARTPGHRIPITAQTLDRVTEVAERLAATLEGDIASPERPEMNPWVMSQETLGSHTLNKNLNSHQVAAYVRVHADQSCSCWRDIPDNAARPHNIFISGWVLSALAQIGEPATAGEVGFVLKEQKPDGWWPVYPVDDDTPFASSYSTAWSLIGLHEQGAGPLRNDAGSPDALAAMHRGSSWLLSRRQHGSRWKDYPLLPNGVVSESISGVVLHALHQTATGRLRQIDAEWLDSLPETLLSASDADHTYIWYKAKEAWTNDDYVQIRLPWLLVGTVDAYENGSVLQRAKALLWIEDALAQPSIATADTIVENWWRAEILFGLRYVLEAARD